MDLERALAAHGQASVRVEGGSMSPTVAQGERVLVRAGRASLGDVALIRARGGLLVHRLVARVLGRWVHKGDLDGARPGLCSDGEVLGLVELPRRRPPLAHRLRWTLAALARVLTLLVLVVGGCKKPAPPPAPEVVELRVVDRTPAAAQLAFADVPALTRAAAQIIGQSGLPVVDGGVNPSALKLRVELRLDGAEDADAKKGVMRAFVEAKLTPVSGPPDALSFEQAAVAERVYDLDKLGDRGAAFRAHAQRAVEDVVRGVGARAKLGRGTSAELLAALGGSDDDLREEAVRLAGERKEKSAVPALLSQLKSDDRPTRDAAIGALAAIGDPRAVKPLTELAHFRELDELPKILDALSAIGGDEARAYLEFVASGHDNPEMRKLAEEALRHLDARRAK
jgi:hypothetical protein